MSRRDWTEGRAKVRGEARCRRCHATSSLDPAHIIQRARIPAGCGAEAYDNFIPLCRTCHEQYDLGDLDVLPLLTLKEQAYSVSLVGIISALERTTGTKWLPVPGGRP